MEVFGRASQERKIFAHVLYSYKLEWWWWSFICSRSSLGPQYVQQLLRKTNAFKTRAFLIISFLSLPSSPICPLPTSVAEHNVRYGIYIYISALWVVGVSWGPSPSLAHPHPSGFLGWGCVWIDSLDWCSASTAQRQPKHWCGVCAVLATSAEHCALQVIGRVS